MTLQELKEKRKSLVEEASKSMTSDELDKIEVEMRKVNIQIEALEEAKGSGEFNPVSTFRNLGNLSDENNDDIYSSMEYRKAFKDYILRGTPIPEKFVEKRGEFTLASDITAIIPTVIMDKVIEDMPIEGNIIPRVTQTSFQGGVQIPISEIDITANWLTNETPSDEQKEKMSTSISFKYHMLEARVAIGLLSQTVSLPAFENTIATQLKKSMLRAIETAIISGTGSGQPKGITTYADLPESQVIEMDSNSVGTVAGWAEAEATIPAAYEDRLIYVMAKGTWEKYLNGMTDVNGQRIGLGKINEKGQKLLNGREVLTVDQLPSFQNASGGDIFAVLCDLSQYYLNSNMGIYFKKYYDEKENKWVFKAMMIVDGQMAIGKNSKGEYVGAKGLIYIKKKI